MNPNQPSEIEIPFKNEENDNLIENKEENESNNLQNNNINEPLFKSQNKKLKNIINKFINSFFLFQFFVINLLFAFIIIIIYIFYYNMNEPNFKIFYYDWDNSYLNDRKYENYLFDNGLEVMVIQDQSFDRDGGAIVIENGYMDNPYDEGIASVATLLLNKITLKVEENFKLSDYYGQYDFGTEEYYTNFRFDILNNGFNKYLYYFSLILNPKNISSIYDQYIENIMFELEEYYKKKIDNIYYKEQHLIEYIVFGLANNNNEDILPEGNIDSLKKI